MSHDRGCQEQRKEALTRNSYTRLGFGLAVAGGILLPFFYFVARSVPLSAFGLSAVMLGITCMALARSVPPVSPEAGRIMLQTGVENIASMLEELGVSGKGVYLPAAMANGRSTAIVPLRQNARDFHLDKSLSHRLIVRHGPDPRDLGISVTTPGSFCYQALEGKPGPTAAEIESALSHILVGILDVARSVSAAFTGDSRVTIRVSDPGLDFGNAWFNRSLGSPIASIAATVTSEALGKPVVISSEEKTGKTGVIELEVLP